MVTPSQRALVIACVPALRAHGVTLTTRFYARLFTAHPALRHIFNMSNQAKGEQQKALAMAVLAYAENIEHPEVLAPVLGIIAPKHASMGIRAEHYPLVGAQLLAAIEEVMGEAATAEVLDAWAAAYEQLAALLIQAETDLYLKAAQAHGGWSGWRPFKVTRVVAESSTIRSLYLEPTDEGALPAFLAGQFVTVRSIDANGLAQLRQYSLSNAPGHGHFRITVKREDALGAMPGGVVSNLLHHAVSEGDVLELSYPQGDFTAATDSSVPLVLLSAGVGITPMLGIVEHILGSQPERPIYFFHATRDRQSHVMGTWLRDKATRHASLEAKVYYEAVTDEDVIGLHHDEMGRMDIAAWVQRSGPANAEFYVCGPRGFMAAQIQALKDIGIEQGRIHAEVFGATLA